MSASLHLRVLGKSSVCFRSFVCCELFLVLFLATHVLSVRVTLSLSTALVHHGSGSRSRTPKCEEQDFELSNLKPLYDGGIKNQVLEGGSPARPGQELPSHQQGSQ